MKKYNVYLVSINSIESPVGIDFNENEIIIEILDENRSIYFDSEPYVPISVIISKVKLKGFDIQNTDNGYKLTKESLFLFNCSKDKTNVYKFQIEI